MKGFSYLIKPSKNNQYLLFLIFSEILIRILRIKCLQVVITLISPHDHLISDSWLYPPDNYDSDFIFLKYLTALQEYIDVVNKGELSYITNSDILL